MEITHFSHTVCHLLTRRNHCWNPQKGQSVESEAVCRASAKVKATCPPLVHMWIMKPVNLVRSEEVKKDPPLIGTSDAGLTKISSKTLGQMTTWVLRMWSYGTWADAKEHHCAVFILPKQPSAHQPHTYKTPREEHHNHSSIRINLHVCPLVAEFCICLELHH